MAVKRATPTPVDVKQVLADDPDFLRPLVPTLAQEALEAEMTAALGAAKGERTPARQSPPSRVRRIQVSVRSPPSQLRSNAQGPAQEPCVARLVGLNLVVAGGSGRPIRRPDVASRDALEKPAGATVEVAAAHA